MIHGWIYDRDYIETEVKFEPNGERATSGLPVGKITEYIRKVVIVRAVVLGTGDPDGMTTDPTTKAITIGTAGGGTISVSPLTQTVPSTTLVGDPPADPYPGWTDTIAEFAEEKLGGGAENLFLGTYARESKFVSETFYWTIGAWGGGGA